MDDYKYLYGPVPSRRLGISLGVSPIPKKTCNYSCVYCQLGRTDHMTNTREMFFPVDKIVDEYISVVHHNTYFDVVTIVGEGEPTLYLGIGELIRKLKDNSTKPVAVITNGALLYDEQVQNDLMEADIILPTLDGYDETSFKRINRPHRSLVYANVKNGLIEFSKKYKGQLWLEIMLVKGMNEDEASLCKYKSILTEIDYDKLYLNTPVRPPAEANVRAVDHEDMLQAEKMLGGISIDLLVSSGFHSEINDDLESIISIIKRHPMNQHEVISFLVARNNQEPETIIGKLNLDPRVETINYKGYTTFRLK